jgi:2-oxoglutarate dehydrogenase complex dehydrogenase (E1) component-like enzyme
LLDIGWTESNEMIFNARLSLMMQLLHDDNGGGDKHTAARVDYFISELLKDLPETKDVIEKTTADN